MTDGERDGTALTRRQVLATTGASGLIGLAGCSGGDDDIDECSGDVSLSKEVEGEFHCGREGTYVFEVCNGGDEECTGELVIEDDLPDGVSFVDVGGNWENQGSATDVRLYNNDFSSTDGLAAGECLTAEMTVEVDGASQFSGGPPARMENCADLVINDTFKDDACVTHDLVCEGACRLSVSKDAEGEFHYGQQATYTFEVCNEQERECGGPLTIEDDLPDGVSFVSVSGNWTATVSGGVVTATNDSYGGLAPGECLTMEMTVAVAPADEFPGDPPHEVENCAALSQSGQPVAEDCLTHPVLPDGDCQLSFSKEQSGEFQHGEQHQAGYVFEVCNEGEAECSGDLAVTDPLPDGISGPVQPGAGMTGGVTGGVFEGTIQYGGLAPGECLTRELLVTVGDADAFSGDPPHEVTNCATLFHDEASVSEECVVHSVTADTPPACEFSFRKEVGEEFSYGQQATYTFEICSDPELNDGECTGPLTIEDDLPDGISFVSVSGNWTATVSGGIVTATNDSYGGLAPGECLTMEMTVEIADRDVFPGDPPHEVENCATLRHQGEFAGDDCASQTLQ